MHDFIKWTLITLGSLASLAIIAVFILFIVGGIFTRPKYLLPWSKSYAKQFNDPRVQLIANAELAPNGHNMQPWKITLDKSNPNVMYLYVDTNKLTPKVDPLYRQTLVSEGTFLEYLKVGGQKLGINTAITLFPNGQYDESNIVNSMSELPVAKVTISKNTTIDSSLYDYMFLADTNRGPYKPTKLTANQINKLINSSTSPNVSITTYQDTANLTKLGAFANAGTKIESTVTSVSKEFANVFRSNEYQKNQYRYGFSVEGQGTTGAMKYLLQGLITLFPSFNNDSASAKRDISLAQNEVSHTPAYAIILTKDNSRTSQVEAGMTYSKLVLEAHSLGLVMQPPSQVLEEYPEMATQHTLITQEYAPNGQTIQMFFRVGQPIKEYPVSMREAATSFIAQ